METKPVSLCLLVAAGLVVFLLPRAEAQRRYTFPYEFRTANEWVYDWRNGVTNVFTGDFNGDGKWDIGVTGRRDEGDRCWYIRYGDGRGGFGGPGREPSYCWQNGVTNAFTGDFNGDGIWDIGVTGTREERDGKWYIRYGDGRGNFGGPGRETVYSWGNTITNIFTGDFDGDGKWDIGVTGRRDENSRKWHIRYGDGKGGFGRETVFDWANGVTNVFTGDFDGDGKWDIGVTGTREEGEARWFIRLGNGNGYFGGRGREPVYSWGNTVNNIFTGDFDGNGGWDIGVTGTREQGYRKWHIRLNARGGILKTLAPPRVTRIGYPDRVMNGELVRVTVQAESHATRVGLNSVGPWIGTPLGNYWEMTRLGNIWVADVVAMNSRPSFIVNAFVGDRAGPPQTFSLSLLRDFAPLSCPSFPKGYSVDGSGAPWMGFRAVAVEGGAVQGLDQWNPSSSKASPCLFLQRFGEGASVIDKRWNGRCCRFVTKDFKVPASRVRGEAFRWSILPPFKSKFKGFVTDDDGYVDLEEFYKQPRGVTGHSVDLFGTVENVVTMVNAAKGGAEYKVTIDKKSSDNQRIIDKEWWAFNYGSRLYANYRQLVSFLGDEFASVTRGKPIRTNWQHLAPTSSMALPLGSAEVIIQSQSTDYFRDIEYGRSDQVLREELAHAVHFQAINRNTEILHRYVMFFAQSGLRSWLKDNNVVLPQAVPKDERPPPADASRVKERSTVPELASWTDLPEAENPTHGTDLLTTEVVAYLEAFGGLARSGVFEDNAQGSALETIREKLRAKQCAASCGATDAAGIGRVDTVMSAAKVIRSEGLLRVLMFLDFPRLAGISVGQVFGMMKRSKAITFREFARYVKSSESRYFGALAQAAARQNIVLDQLVVKMGSN